MNARTVLFPTDFSASAEAGLEYATSLARDSGGKLLIVHVEEPPLAVAAGEMYYGIPQPNTEALARLLEAVKPTDPAVPCEHRLLAGDPAGTVVDFAKRENVDVIVMGTHGRRGLSRLLMGSVAEAVVRRAECPVLTVKPTHHAPVTA